MKIEETTIPECSECNEPAELDKAFMDIGEYLSDPAGNKFCESCYENYSDRHRALARHLGVAFGDLTECKWDDKQFELRTHKVKRGTGPDEAREYVALVRKALEIVYPNENTTSWTTGYLLEQYTEAKKLDLTETKKALTAQVEKVFDKLDMPRSEKVDFTDLNEFIFKLERALMRRVGSPALTMKANRSNRGYLQRKIEEACKDHIHRPMLKVLVDIQELDLLIQKYEALRKRKEASHTYDNIVARFRANPETLAMTKIGIHDLVNSLYFICPNSRDGYGADNALAHSDALREAFNGVEIKDRRTDEEADDGEYMILDNDEADELWDQDLQNYLDECVLPELPENARAYFNEEKWKDAARGDGRAHSLGRYDGQERVEDDQETGRWYIYRVN